MANQRETTMLPEEEIANLSRRQRAAFAARCARRVLPLYKARWPNAPEKHVAALERAIAISEGFASAVRGPAAYAARAVEAASHAAAAADAAADAVNSRGTAVAGPARAIAFAAASAASAAASTAANDSLAAASIVDAMRSVSACATCAAVAAGSVEKIIVNAIQQDFERLRDAVKQQGWRDQSPVPPEFFGLLWPAGEPKGWPFTLAMARDQRPVGDSDQRLVLRCYVREFAPVGEVVDELKKLVYSLNAYHIAAGGSGLVIDDWQTLTRAEEPAEVLS